VTPIHSVQAWLESFNPSAVVTLAVLQNRPGTLDMIFTVSVRFWPAPSSPMFQVAVLPLTVLLEMFIRPLFEMPPPVFAIGNVVEFPLIVLATTVIVPELEFETPPPNAALFPVTLQRVRLRVPLFQFSTPPPVVDETLLVITQFVRLRVPKPRFATPPSGLDPLLSVSPETLTVGRFGPFPEIEKTPNGLAVALPPTTVSWLEPGPWILSDLLVVKVSGDPKLLDSSSAQASALKQQVALFSESDLVRFFHSLAETECSLKDAANPRYQVEVGLVKLMEMRRLASLSDLVDRISELEAALRTGTLPSCSRRIGVPL
jgi:hypothetical protein